MSSYPLSQCAGHTLSPLLNEIPEPPKTLWHQGRLPPPDLTLLAVVGSRQYTSYGKQVVEHLIKGLAPYPIGIVSGLAIGIDTLAHEAALAHGLYTLAVPGSGLDETVLYPARNKRLARRILDSSGGLLSELPPSTKAAPWTFPARNRLMAGLCPATLLIEAGAASGTLITARMATDYNREVLVVPGSIFSPTSVGTHQFLKLGATPVTTVTDILLALRLEALVDEVTPAPPVPPAFLPLLTHLREPLDRDTLIRRLGLPVAAASALLMEAELAGIVTVQHGIYTALVTSTPPSLFDRSP